MNNNPGGGGGGGWGAPAAGGSTGTVKKWNAEKGFGFIGPSDGSADVFCHYRQIQGGKALQEGAQVNFTTAPSPRDPSKTEAKNVTGPADKNTADPPGDVSFVLSKKNITQQCLHNPGSMGCHTDVENHDLYGAFVIEIDGQWGPYQMCNPANGWDTASWKCGLNCMSPTEEGCPDSMWGKRNGT
eukprot:gene14902-11753_t